MPSYLRRAFASLLGGRRAFASLLGGRRRGGLQQPLQGAVSQPIEGELPPAEGFQESRVFGGEGVDPPNPLVFPTRWSFQRVGRALCSVNSCKVWEVSTLESAFWEVSTLESALR